MKIFTILLSVILLITGVSNFYIDITYYHLLRWIVTVGAVFLSVKYYKNKNQALFATFCIVAIIFNPIAPIYLQKSIWKIIDIIAGVLFILPSLEDYSNNTKKS